MIKVRNNRISTEVEFEKIEQIGNGQGANSDVYKVRDVQLDAVRAAKQVEASKFSGFDEYFAEAQKMHDAAHPNVVPIHFAGTGVENGEDYIYIIMDYYSRGSLAGLQEKTPLRVGQIVRYSLQFLTGLAFIHSRQIAHFDIKPTNILLKEEGVAALTDFGIAERLNKQGSADSPTFYIPHVSPERVSVAKQNHLTDIYQAGLTLYRLCHMPDEWAKQLQKAKTQYGPNPNQSLARAVIDGHFPDRDAFPPHVPERLRTVIQKATQINPNDRYKSVRSMMNELGRVKRYLGWQMLPNDSDTGHEAWETKDSGGRHYRIQICENGSDWSVETKKTVNQTQRVRSCCADGIQSRKEAQTRVQTFIRSEALDLD